MSRNPSMQLKFKPSQNEAVQVSEDALPGNSYLALYSIELEDVQEAIRHSILMTL